jgi:predicted chitinase
MTAGWRLLLMTPRPPPFIGRPEASADRTDYNWMGNRDEYGGDGWRFQGLGLIQMTGRATFCTFAQTEAPGASVSGR